jgi:hypothetical protein
MGRLTLNVLLSFAQFEREVTGERIRDKIAASKQKGMWMGGIPPIGYRGSGRTLEVDDAGASVIREIYRRYLDLGCVRRLKHSLDANGMVTPARRTVSGTEIDGRSFSRGQLYRILSHPVYVGKIVHRDQMHDGRHAAIIEQGMWDAVQVKLAANRQGYQERRSTPSASLLTGLAVDAEGHRLIPSHSQKQSRRYRYYLSAPLLTEGRESVPRGLRLPAEELEQLVVDALRNWLSDAHVLMEELSHAAAADLQSVLAQAQRWAKSLTETPEDRYRIVQRLVQRVVVHPESVQITLLPAALLDEGLPTHAPDAPPVVLDVPVQVRRCGLSMRLVVPGATGRTALDAGLIEIVNKGRDWLERLTSGKATSIADIAAAEGVTGSHVTRVIYRAFLAPDIVRSIMAGQQPSSLTADTLKRIMPLPLDWGEQRMLLGFIK